MLAFNNILGEGSINEFIPYVLLGCLMNEG